MSGLYQRALEYIQAQRQLRLVRPDELEDDDELDVSPEDKEKILSQINEIVEKNRIKIEPDTFDFRPKKNGGVLPLIFNIAAVLLMAGGGYWLLNYFDRSEASIVTNRAGIQSAEGKLLETLKAESEQRLTEKEQAISEIQGRLEEMNQERIQLESNTEAIIQEREAELRASMEEELARERTRLQEQGVSQEDIANRLADFEEQQQAEFASTLESVKNQAAEALERQKETLDQLSSEYEQALSSAEQEKTALLDELTRQEASLLAEFQQKEAVLESDRLDALQALDAIRSEQESEQLVLDQILSFYDSVRRHLSTADLDGALASLGELRSYLNQSDVATLEGVRRRRMVEIFLIDSLEKLVDEQKQSESPDTISLIKSAEMVSAASVLVERGNAKFLSADFADAKELYIAALTEVPAVEVGFKRLQEIDARVADEQQSEIAAIFSNANEAYVTGEYRRAVTLYGDALELIPPVTGASDQMLSQLTLAGYQLNREGDLDTIRNLQTLVARQSSDLERLAALQQELDTLQLANEEYGQELERLSALEEELGTLKARAAESAVELAKVPLLEGQIEELELKLAEATAAAESAVEPAKISQLEGQIEELESKLAEATAAAAESTVALARIPELEGQIDELESKLADSTAAAEALKERGAFLETEIERLATEAAEDAQQLLTMDALRAEVNRLSNQIPVLETEIDRLKPYETGYLARQEMLADLSSLRTKYVEATGIDAEEEDPLAILEHLETKLLIKRIVDSDPVRTEYPDLYDKIERYLEALEEENFRDARVLTLKNINGLIDNVISGGVVADDIEATYTDAAERDELLGLIDRLKRLLN